MLSFFFSCLYCLSFYFSIYFYSAVIWSLFINIESEKVTIKQAYFYFILFEAPNIKIWLNIYPWKIMSLLIDKYILLGVKKAFDVTLNSKNKCISRGLLCMNLEYRGNAKRVVHSCPSLFSNYKSLYFKFFFFTFDSEAYFPLLSCSLNLFGWFSCTH